MSSPKKFFFDVWLSQGKTVYKDVPYEVITDWLQQGRLLGDDRIRPAGTEEWFPIAGVPTFAGYIPKNDPLRTDEKAEALEPVETGWVHKEEEEEADPDMIPLIDVSLVLLIFFMITSTVAAVTSTIPVPLVKNLAEPTGNINMIWIGIEFQNDQLPAKFLVRLDGDNDKKIYKRDLDKDEAIKMVNDILESRTVPEVRIAAHKQVSYDLVKELHMALEEHKAKSKIIKIHVEVGEKK